jgi:tryptophan synthase alpha chain
MNRIDRRFRELREKGEKALVLYLTAGDPSLGRTLEIIPALEEAGADLVEIGIPFSDPTADGPIIQAASRRALEKGTTLTGILELIARLRQRTDIPVVLFSYYNPIWVYGPERFSLAAQAAGVDGILVVDLPLEEGGELRKFSDPAGLDFISLVAPTTGTRRLAAIAARAQGFLYYISIIGITGTAAPELTALERRLTRIRRVTHLPLVVGFGLSDPEQVRSAARSVDGVVVGSALVRMIHERGRRDARMGQVSAYVRRLKRALI